MDEKDDRPTTPPADGSRSKAARLRALLRSPEPEFLMEAHSGVSARIVEEAGFPGIWASGLALSAQFGVRDNNEVSWTQVVDALEFMSDATSIPILVDGDTGHGNFNNLRRLVRKLEQRGVAGVCIEDKLFPKQNSFLGGERQPLADVEEFCGKLHAAKDTQRDPDFVVVARIEALIAGWGMDEALQRAERYREAGADAVLIHSKSPKPDEVLAFARAWNRRCPLVVVPTTYYATPPEAFALAGVQLVIWANHMLRASVASMEAVAREVREARSVANAEDHVASLREIFRLQGVAELAEAESRYLAAGRRTRAVVLAAARGRGLESLTTERPKVMIPVRGEPLLRRLVTAFKESAVHDVTVVAGYRSEAIDVEGIAVVENPRHEETGELASLACARDGLAGDCLVVYGDLLFRRYILEDLLDAPQEVVVVVDSRRAAEGGSRDFAWCSEPDDLGLERRDVLLQRVDTDADRAASEEPSGRWIGMSRFRGEGCAWLRESFERLSARPDFAQLDLPALLNDLVEAGHPVHVQYVRGHWLDVNSAEDLDRAGRFAPDTRAGSRRCNTSS